MTKTGKPGSMALEKPEPGTLEKLKIDYNNISFERYAKEMEIKCKFS